MGKSLPKKEEGPAAAAAGATETGDTDSSRGVMGSVAVKPAATATALAEAVVVFPAKGASTGGTPVSEAEIALALETVRPAFLFDAKENSSLKESDSLLSVMLSFLLFFLFFLFLMCLV